MASLGEQHILTVQRPKSLFFLVCGPGVGETDLKIKIKIDIIINKFQKSPSAT